MRRTLVPSCSVRVCTLLLLQVMEPSAGTANGLGRFVSGAGSTKVAAPRFQSYDADASSCRTRSICRSDDSVHSRTLNTFADHPIRAMVRRTLSPGRRFSAFRSTRAETMMPCRDRSRYILAIRCAAISSRVNGSARSV